MTVSNIPNRPMAEVRHPPLAADGMIGLDALLRRLTAHWALLLLGTFAMGAAGYGMSMLIPPTFTARASVIPPQQQGGAAAGALAQLGALASLAGGSIKTPADQYVALLQSVTVSDRIIDQFKLIDVYGSPVRQDARKDLAENARVSVGKKDGLLFIEVDDRDPKRAAAIANAYVEQLRLMTNTLAVTEAQQRRVFFEQQLKASRDNLTRAQTALQSSGFNSGALKAEPKAAAEAYARLRVEVTAAELKVQSLRSVLTERAPEVIQQQAVLARLRSELSRAEQQRSEGAGDADYISKFREYKYQETLFELFARQYELARVDESREGGLIQVVDAATPPERRSKPRRGLIAAMAATLGFVVLATWAALRRPRVSARPA